MWFETQDFSSPKQPIVSQQPTQPLVDQVVEPISYLVDPTLLSESDFDVIKPMSSLVNSTLPSESDFHEAVELNLLNKGALNLLQINPHQAPKLLRLIGIA